MTVASAAEQLAAAGCVLAEEEAAILVDASRTAEELAAALARRVAGEPLEHVLGRAEFRGLRLTVEPGLFVPRPRSGLLVEEAARLLRCLGGPGREVTVVDVCCGVGAIGAALASELPRVRLHATDLDPRAVACAERNLAPYGGRVHHGDLLDALPRQLRGRTDLVVASPPYVPTDELRLLPSEAREFEPPVALDGGSDGLALAARLARQARQWLTPDGRLAVEVAVHQVDDLVVVLEELGYVSHALVDREDGAAVAVGSPP